MDLIGKFIQMPYKSGLETNSKYIKAYKYIYRGYKCYNLQPQLPIYKLLRPFIGAIAIVGAHFLRRNLVEEEIQSVTFANPGWTFLSL